MYFGKVCSESQKYISKAIFVLKYFGFNNLKANSKFGRSFQIVKLEMYVENKNRFWNNV